MSTPAAADARNRIIATAVACAVLFPISLLVARRVASKHSGAVVVSAAANSPAEAVAPAPAPSLPAMPAEESVPAVPAREAARPEAGPNVGGTRFESAPMNISDRDFFAFKFRRPAVYDTAIGGDSRILVGVSPGAMRNWLPEDRIFNFGFRGACWTGDYMEALAALLDPQSKRKRIVLGVSPLGLTPAKRASNGFQTVRRRVQSGLLERSSGAMPTMIDDGEMAGEFRNGIFYVYHDDGWVGASRPGSNKVVRKIEKSSATPIDDGMVDEMMAAVKKWTAQGITVYGFRPPISPRLHELEGASVNFDEEAFSRRFIESGGRWLKIKTDGLFWKDGHHLDVPSALTFSRRLGEKIRTVETSETRLARE